MHRIFLLLVCLIWVGTASAQDAAAGWQVLSAESLVDVTGEQPRDPVMSPDGRMIAWSGGSEGLCIYTLESDANVCYPTPDEFASFGRYSYLAWSPDSAYLTFNDSFFDYFHEPDLWMFDVAAETFTNRTDDGMYDDMLTAAGLGATMDYAATWNPVNNDLYFFRSAELPDGQDGVTLELQLMPVGRTEPKLAHDLTGEFPVYSVYRPPVISPDGTHMALITLPQRYIDDPVSGVWVLDLKTGDLQQVAELADFYKGLPGWLPPDAVPLPDTMIWAGNDALIVQANNPAYGLMLGLYAYYIDLSAGTVQPMVDFSALEDESDLYEEDAEGLTPQMRMPHAGVVTPDGSSYLYVGAMPEIAVVYSLALPPDGGEPVEIERIDPYEVGSWTLSNSVMTPEGRALMWGYLFQFGQE